MPTHYRTGVSNAMVGEALYQMGQLDPSKYITFFDDFLTLGSIPAAGTDSVDWNVTLVGSGTAAVAQMLGGGVTVTTGATDDNSNFYNLLGEPFQWSSTTDMFFKARFKVDDAVDSDVLFGLQISDTTPVDASDGIFFLKADGAATTDFIVRKDATDTSLTSVATLANDTFVTLGFAYTANDATFRVYVNDVEAAKTAVITNAPDDEPITVSFGVQAGEGEATVLTVDYIFAAQARVAGPAV